MKKRVLLIMCAGMLLLGGCGKKGKMAEAIFEKVAQVFVERIENAGAVTEEVTEAESISETMEESIEDMMEESTEDTIEEIIDERIDETIDETDDMSEETTDNTGETEDIDYISLIYDYAEKCNALPVDLSAKIGEFYSFNGEDADPVEDPEGEYYGFVSDLTAGCSVWCAVEDSSVKAKATSTLDPIKEFTYEAKNIINGELKNGWVEGVDSYGIGESVTIKKSYKVTNGEAYGDNDCIFFTNLCIVNGLAKTEKAWKENSRVKILKMYFNDEYVCDLELLDTRKPQYISLSGLYLGAKDGEKSSFRFEIADVYKGDKYEDTAITGIEIEFDTPNH